MISIYIFKAIGWNNHLVQLFLCASLTDWHFSIRWRFEKLKSSLHYKMTWSRSDNSNSMILGWPSTCPKGLILTKFEHKTFCGWFCFFHWVPLVESQTAAPLSLTESFSWCVHWPCWSVSLLFGNFFLFVLPFLFFLMSECFRNFLAAAFNLVNQMYWTRYWYCKFPGIT